MQFLAKGSNTTRGVDSRAADGANCHERQFGMVPRIRQPYDSGATGSEDTKRRLR